MAQWAHQVKRLSQLGFADEVNELDQSLIDLPRNDSELQQELLHPLKTKARRQSAGLGNTS